MLTDSDIPIVVDDNQAAEPEFLAEPPDLSELRDGQVWPVADVRRLIGRTWKAARVQFRARLERDVAKARTKLEAEFEARRNELIAETVRTTRALMRGE